MSRPTAPRPTAFSARNTVKGGLDHTETHRVMPLRCVVLAGLVLAASPAFADPPNLAFQPAGDGLFDFDTGVLKGRLKLDGKYQGLYPFVDAATGMELVHPPGVFSFYRVLTNNRRYGNAARDWPTVAKLLADGAVEVHWPTAEKHPLEMTAVYRWSATDTLDLEIAVTPQQEMQHFELFMSSYFGKTFRASVYVKDDGENPRFEPADRTPGAHGGYVMFPRDAKAVEMIRDGRWKIPPNPVDWNMGRSLAAPLAIRRDTTNGLTAVMMSRPEDCFAVASPWNPASPEAGGYRSLYLSLFGRDLRAGQTAHARCRLVLRRNISDEQAVQRFEEFLKQAGGEAKH